MERISQTSDTAPGNFHRRALRVFKFASVHLTQLQESVIDVVTAVDAAVDTAGCTSTRFQRIFFSFRLYYDVTAWTTTQENSSKYMWQWQSTANR